jgi:hypothetical protein
MSRPDLLTQIFGFLSTIALFLGKEIVQLIRYVLPSIQNIDVLAEPLGYLAILSIFVILTSVARKVALVVLVAGWALIFIRLVLMALRIG